MLEDVCLSLDEVECFERRLLSEELVLEELVFDDRCEEEEEDDDDDFSDGTSRMFNVRPVVGSVVED